MSETKIFNLTGSYTEKISEANMNERTIKYLVETVTRLKTPETSEAEVQTLFESFRNDMAKNGFSVTAYVLAREIHEYLAVIPKLEKYR